MQKINFQNLPSTTTPINATNLNAIQTNAENAIDLKADISYVDNYANGTNTMGNIVVSGIRTKNMFDGIFTQGHHTSSTATNRISNVGLAAIKSVNGKSYTLSTNLPSSYKWKIMNCSSNQLNPTIYNDTNYVSSGSVTVNSTGNGYLIIIVGKTDDSNLNPSSVASYQFQVEEGSATSYTSYQNLNPYFIEASSQTQVLAGEKYRFNNGYIIYAGTIVVSFSNGIANLNITDLHLSQKPYSVIATISSEKYGIRYDFDNSSATSLRFELFNGSGGTYSKTGNVRFSAIISGITSI